LLSSLATHHHLEHLKAVQRETDILLKRAGALGKHQVQETSGAYLPRLQAFLKLPLFF